MQEKEGKVSGTVDVSFWQCHLKVKEKLAAEFSLFLSIPKWLLDRICHSCPWNAEVSLLEVIHDSVDSSKDNQFAQKFTMFCPILDDNSRLLEPAACSKYSCLLPSSRAAGAKLALSRVYFIISHIQFA